jgi:murein DD-endopeptidase MepM/ murein hydrolase activator NlpD
MRKPEQCNLHVSSKKFCTSVTIMVIPHNSFKALNLKVSVIGLFISILFATITGGYVLCLAVHDLKFETQHRAMAEKVKFYSEQFYQWNSTLTSLKKADSRFRQLFSLRSREEVLQYADASSIGDLEIPDLTQELKKSIAKIAEIKEYLRIQKDAYAATPVGYPVSGNISSPYGKRVDPLNGETAFHSGIDISCSSGSPVRATADGIVSHSGWTQEGGFVVVLEHGYGFSTIYAHDETNTVRVGEKVKRGDIIGYAGSTGRSTGPHVHYEVWKAGKAVDPQQSLFRTT